jgi:glycosyltransferase involved in cell wall biosynthesis
MIVVSVIVPCYNEEATIRQLLEAVYGQTYPINKVEVVIADGLSTDGTRAVVNDFKSNHTELQIRVVDNALRVIPSGLNRAIEAASGKYIVRLDAHSVPSSDYIQNCVYGLENDLGDNVGGVWKIQPGADSWMAKSIAIAAAHPIGAGDARYRIGGVAQEVDTVPFGAFEKELVNHIGKFNETLLTNEDYEFNTRLRLSGGRVWMDPKISSIYYARPTLRELAKQYWRYGYWKAQMLRRYPKTLRWRQIIPPLFVLSLLCLSVLSLISRLARWLLAIIVILYIILIIGIGIQMSLHHKGILYAIGVPLATAVIHLSWGAAFLWGMIVKPKVILEPEK